MTEQPFDRALRQAATTYRQFYPGEESRLGRGLEIALNRCVELAWLNGRFVAEVHSASDPEVVYNVDGTQCDCPDKSAPGARCKHRYAVALIRIAQALHDLRDHEAA